VHPSSGCARSSATPRSSSTTPEPSRWAAFWRNHPRSSTSASGPTAPESFQHHPQTSVLLQACQRTLLQFGLDYSRDSLLYDLSGRELYIVDAGVGRLADDNPDRGGAPDLRRGALVLGSVLPARRANADIVQPLCATCNGIKGSEVVDYSKVWDRAGIPRRSGLPLHRRLLTQMY
jgi:hypothetical protein